MPRFYSQISKESFLEKVRSIMEHEDFPYEESLSDQILKDLSKVNFDFENYTSFRDNEEGFSTYPVGYWELNPGFHVFFVNAGGDWEYPICFIFYWDGKQIRAYIPEDGNAWNKKEKCAYGSESNEDADDENHDDEVNEEKIIVDILSRILPKN
jgi:hypothetical protein